MIRHSYLVTYEFYLRVSKVWIIRNVLTNADDLLGIETYVKILTDYGDARNSRTIELDDLPIRIGGNVPAYDRPISGLDS